MANQTIEFPYVSALTLTVEISPIHTDAITATVSAVEATVRKGVYSATFTDLAAGQYRFRARIGTQQVYTDTVEVEATTAVYLGTGEDPNTLSLLKAIHTNTAG